MFCVSRIVPVEQPELDPAVTDVNCKEKVRHGKFRTERSLNRKRSRDMITSLPFLKGVVDFDDGLAAVSEEHQGIIG